MVSRIVVGEFEHNLWNWAPTANYCTTNDIESSIKYKEDNDESNLEKYNKVINWRSFSSFSHEYSQT